MSSEASNAPAVEPPPVASRPATAPPRVDHLPPWKVLLHNDDVNYLEDVVETIVMLGMANRHAALLRALEAHDRGLSLLAVTHRERAELIQEQFATRRLTVTIEPA